MSNPLFDKLRKTKSLGEALQVIEKNKDYIDINFIDIILKDIISYKNLGNTSFAFDLTEVALLCSNILNNEDYIIRSKLSRADLYSITHNFQETFKICNEVRTDYNIKKFEEAESYLIEGNAYSILRNYENSLKFYRTAKKLYKEIDNKIKYYTAKLNIARVYLDNGYFIKAENLFYECEKFFETKGKDALLVLAASIDGRAKTIRSKNYQLCLELLNKAYELYKEGNSPIRAFYVRLFITELYLDLGLYSEVHDEYKEIRKILKTLNLKLELARVNWYEAIAYAEEREYILALKLIQNAKNIFKEFDILPDYARILRNEGIIKFLMENYNESIKIFSKARDIFQKYNMPLEVEICNINEAYCRREINDDERAEKLAFKALKYAENSNIYSLIVSCKAFIGNLFEKKKLYHEAVGWYEESIELIEKMRINLKSERMKIGFIQNKTMIYEQLILIYSFMGIIDAAIETIERSKLQALLDIARENILDKHMIKSLSFQGINEIQEIIDEETSIIEYYVTPKFCLIFIISKNTIQFEYKKISQEMLSQEVQSLLRQIVNNEELKNNDIYNVLIEPCNTYIEEKKKLFIIPHKFLFSLPFNVLKNELFMIEKYKITIFPNLTILYYLLNKDIGEKSKLLAFANPQNDLSQSENETIEINKYFKNKKIFLKNDATKESFYKNITEFNVLHIACHGIFDEKSPQKSALIFADLPIYFPELYGSYTNLSLVTLSACMSGKLRIEAGDEILGLLRGFIYSGARSIIASLWEVFENPSFIFITSFYEQLNNVSVLEAFQNAIIKVKTDYPSPIYWASYFLLGDCR